MSEKQNLTGQIDAEKKVGPLNVSADTSST